MRKAYIGLSSPIFYDYGNPASQVSDRQVSSPNPILDGPFGLMLFFDELWFLTRSLCPENLRSSQFVFFLDESNLLDGFDFDADYEIEDYFDPAQLEHQRAGFSDYEATLFKKGIHWWGQGARIDNHTHQLVSPALKSEWVPIANSMDARRVVFDLAVMNHLGAGYELITNTFTDRLLALDDCSIVSPREFADAMLYIDDIPNYQTPTGPYHSCIDELRERGDLPHFRQWICGVSKTVSRKEIAEVKQGVEATLRDSIDRIVTRYFDKGTEVTSLGKTFFGWSLDWAAPGTGRIYKMIDSWSDHRKREKSRWQGFLLAARRSTSLS